MYEALNFQEDNMLDLITKDVMRTVPSSFVFRNEKIQRSIRRILIIYSIRHPINSYNQGMNDILAPIFAVYLSSLFERSYL